MATRPIRRRLSYGHTADLPIGPLSVSSSVTIERLVAEDDHVVLLAKGTATAQTGRPYKNSYCIVAQFTDGKIVTMTDYIDTELITSALVQTGFDHLTDF